MKILNVIYHADQFVYACALLPTVLSGSSSTTPTPVGSEDTTPAPTSTAETVKLLQTASAAATTSGKKTEGEGGGGGGDSSAGDTTNVTEEEEDNVVTTIDEVCVLCDSIPVLCGVPTLCVCVLPFKSMYA